LQAEYKRRTKAIEQKIEEHRSEAAEQIKDINN